MGRKVAEQGVQLGSPGGSLASVGAPAEWALSRPHQNQEGVFPGFYHESLGGGHFPAEKAHTSMGSPRTAAPGTLHSGASTHSADSKLSELLS